MFDIDLLAYSRCLMQQNLVVEKTLVTYNLDTLWLGNSVEPWYEVKARRFPVEGELKPHLLFALNL